MRPFTRTALAALMLGVPLLTPALAQEQVRVFEDAPSIEELRAILIPESTPGKTRKIEIPRASPSGSAPSTNSPNPASPPAVASSGNANMAGAAMPAVQPTSEKPRVIQTVAAAVAFRINFASNSDVIPSTYRQHLDRMAAFLREEPELTLTIEGHTDAYGSVEYNLNLSRRRAVAVMRYLVDHGIDAGRLVAVGKGKSSPMISDPFDGRNRRVQFVNTGPQGRT